MEHRETLLEVRNLKKHFPVNKGMFKNRVKGVVKAVDDVSFTLYKGETLGLIGESGCGKSTLSRVLLGLIPATGGEILFKGEPMAAGGMDAYRKQVQMIFQDPYSSLDPRMSVRRIIEEPLRIHTKLSSQEKRKIVLPLLERVSLDEESLGKYPHEFSGGQRQRIGIARALVLNPEFLICDEPVSALDMSVQAQILNLFLQMQRELGLTYLFISHDMGVVRHMSTRVIVMYLGRIMEIASKRDLFEDTLHPYTEALMSAIPVPDPEAEQGKIVLKGDLPSPINPPPGCPFQTRCPKVMELCREVAPPLREVKEEHFAACHLYPEGGEAL